MIELQLAGIGSSFTQRLEFGMVRRRGEASHVGKRDLVSTDMIGQVGMAARTLHVRQLDQRNIAPLVLAVTGAAAHDVLRPLVGMVRRSGVAGLAAAVRSG